MRKTFTKEAHVKEAVKEILTKLGIWYFMPSMNGFGRMGIPDFVCCVQGRFLGLETKFGKNKPTPHQERELAAISHAGGWTFVVNEHNVDLLEVHLSALFALEPQ